MIRCIGDPEVRFLEDPVRMLRAVVLAARLQFSIDQPVLEAIAMHRHEIARSAPPRLVEEYYKILRSGHAQEAFKQLRTTGLLKAITPELAGGRRRVAVDRRARRYRARFDAAPESLTNAILAGTLLIRSGSSRAGASRPMRSNAGSSSVCCRLRGATSNGCSRSSRCSRGCSTPRRRRAPSARCSTASVLPEAITWLEIHGDRPDVVAHWRALQAEPRDHAHAASDETARAGLHAAPPRRRRRGGRGRSPTGQY